MSALDTLGYLLGSAAEGVQAGRRLKMETAEARRKALLEERDTAVREKNLDLLGEQLKISKRKQDLEERTAQVERMAALMGLGERGSAMEFGTTPITEGGAPLNIPGYGGQMLHLPGTIKGLGVGGDLLRQAQENALRISHPEFFGGARRVPTTEEEMMGRLFGSVLGSEPTLAEMGNQKAYFDRIEQLLNIAEARIRNLYGKGGKDNSDPLGLGIGGK